MNKKGPKPYDLACPNPKCPYFGVHDKGNIVRYGTYGEFKKPRYRCQKSNSIPDACGKTFSATRGTILYRMRADKTNLAKMVFAVKSLEDGYSVSAIAHALLPVCKSNYELDLKSSIGTIPTGEIIRSESSPRTVYKWFRKIINNWSEFEKILEKEGYSPLSRRRIFKLLDKRFGEKK